MRIVTVTMLCLTGVRQRTALATTGGLVSKNGGLVGKITP
ncbi:hypothetical protein Pla111_11130 [Botrimarina hoheduenensis]|uniref:Uncharacterized protein n=1 Tax=Botrimarina hoheduenensis TaxID=2528000 RepID=A0A5C5WBN7_9BACT|nr:hypothetical protein Pla111_11130 [Botrimarina hoheduenensis]